MNEANKLVVFVTHSPLDADEYVWIDTDFEKEIDAELVQKPSPYKVDKIIYLVNRTTELDDLYKKLSKEEFKKLDLRTMKEFNYWNCSVIRVSMIARWS